MNLFSTEYKKNFGSTIFGKQRKLKASFKNDFQTIVSLFPIMIDAFTWAKFDLKKKLRAVMRSHPSRTCTLLFVRTPPCNLHSAR